MKPEKAISLLQRGIVGEIYDEKGYLTALGYEALDAIDNSNCPTLVQRPHGEWIEKPCGVVCSRCKAQALHTPNGNQSRSDYCPNCGADMRRKEGDTNDQL